MHRPTENTRGLGSASNTRRSQQGRGGEDEAGRRGRVGNGHCGGAVLLGVGRVRVLTVRSVGWGHDGRLGRGRGRGVRRRLGLLLLGCSGSGRRRGVLRCGGRRWYVGVGGWPRRGGRRAAEELGREQHAVDRVDDRGRVVEHGGRDAGLVDAGVQRDVVAPGFDGEAELPRAGGGQGGDVALGDLERRLGRVPRQGVVLQERDELGAGELVQIGQVLGLERFVVGREQRQRLVHGRLVHLDGPGRDDEARELLAASLLEDAGEVGRRGRRGAEEAGEGDGVGDLEDGEVVGLLLDALGVGSLELGAGRGRGEGDLAAAEVGDVDVAHVPGGVAGGLVERGGELGAGVEGVQLLLVVVVEEGEEAERVLDVRKGEVGDEGGHGAVVEHEDRDGAAAVDLVGDLGHGEVAVVQRVLRQAVEHGRDVVGGRRRGGEGDEQEDEAAVRGDGHGAGGAEWGRGQRKGA
jgi:hypothetical protein